MTKQAGKARALETEKERNRERMKKHRKLQIPVFTLTALAAMAVLLLWSRLQPGELFRKNIQTTYYETISAGEEPELDAADYFSEEEYDLTKFSFDVTNCDTQTPGEYEIPVWYDGKETNCIIKLTVE